MTDPGRVIPYDLARELHDLNFSSYLATLAEASARERYQHPLEGDDPAALRATLEEAATAASVAGRAVSEFICRHTRY